MRRSVIDNWLSERERLSFPPSRADIEALQLERLNETLAVCALAAFYKNRLPSRVGSLAELASLPFTTPEDVSRVPSAFLACSQSEIARIITDETSGTAGGAKRVFYTEDDLERTASFFACGLSEFIGEGDRALICMPSTKRGSVGELISRAIASLGAEPHIFGVGRAFREWLQEARERNINRIVAMPVPLLSFARFAKAEGARLNISGALVSADACHDSMLSLISSALGGCELFPHYGSRESGLGGAITCPAHAGMHIRENDLLCEIIDPSGRSAREGERGELVITTLTRRAMPLVRYRTGDFTRFCEMKCACGSEVRRIDAVERAASAPIDIAALDDVLFSNEDILDYSATLRDGILEIDLITIRGTAEGAREAAMAIYTQGEVSVRARAYSRDEAAPAYIGKRYIRTEGL